MRDTPVGSMHIYKHPIFVKPYYSLIIRSKEYLKVPKPVQTILSTAASDPIILGGLQHGHRSCAIDGTVLSLDPMPLSGSPSGMTTPCDRTKGACQACPSDCFTPWSERRRRREGEEGEGGLR